ncbi:MAG: glycoside hydrolase family 95 protein [Chitinophagaceae bacterium]|nr:glycoside hydrolase family 95 protein [Chitinophagaceae bacterium]
MRLIFLFIMLVSANTINAQPKDLELWYRQPAAAWTDGMPVGNGRIGAMVFGKYDKELIQLNEESVWAGSKINNNNKNSVKHLPEIQSAIFKGEYKKALQLASQYMVGTPPRVRSYQPLGNLYIHFGEAGTPDRYKRALNLNTGVATTTFEIAGNKITQEVYVSAPHDVLVVTVRAARPLNLYFELSRERDVNEYKVSGKDIVYYTGQIIDQDDTLTGPGGKHMHFAGAMQLLAANGRVKPVAGDTSAGYRLDAVTNVSIAVTGATDYNADLLDTDVGIDPMAVCIKKLSKAVAVSVTALKEQHIKEHRSYFERVQFSLGNRSNDSIPTDERLKRVKAGVLDHGLIVLYYQFGRYLLMGSSRGPATLPANLQGIWNNLYNAPWNSDFHTNINLQMNYWPAETGNLSETVLPLAHFMKKLAVPGAVTAREMYNADGWTLHHLTDVYGRTGVADGVWGVSPMAGPWMTFPLYRHYEFTGDKKYLRDIAYPVMKGSVQFVLDFLIQSPDGYLVTNPSHSPENAFFVPGSNKQETSQLSYATTIDIEIIQGLFNNFIEAAAVLNADADWVEKVKAAARRLPPIKIASNGTIQEWIEDFEEVEPGHRHMSHLLGLYPLNLISLHTPGLFAAAKKTIERRLANGGGHTGWSKAWVINFYARLLNGNEAGLEVQSLLQRSTLISLLSTHPPFQIDGNFGGTAGIAEMLLQSHNKELHILPALPDAWPSGSIKGLRARGGYGVDIQWEKGALQMLGIQAAEAGAVKIRYKDTLVERRLVKGFNKIVL